MSKTLWHTIQIQVPKEMIELNKSGSISIKKTLTKTFNISKSNKIPAIKLIPSNDNKAHVINDGKEWNVDELKARMAKVRAMKKKNENKNIFEPNVKKMNKVLESNIIKRARELGETKKEPLKVNDGIELTFNEVVLMLYDISRRKLHIPLSLIPKLMVNGKRWIDLPQNSSTTTLEKYNDALNRGDKFADGLFELYTYDIHKRTSHNYKDPRYKLEVYNIKPELFPKGKPVQQGGRKRLRIHHL